MKIIVADKISERGFALLREAGWEVVTPAAGTLVKEIATADGLVVRSATKVTAELLDKPLRNFASSAAPESALTILTSKPPLIAASWS